MVLGVSYIVAADPYHPPLRLHPPLVSFIALLGSPVFMTALDRLLLPPRHLDNTDNHADDPGPERQPGEDPGPTAFGFGSERTPSPASTMIRMSGPVPTTRVASPTLTRRDRRYPPIRFSDSSPNQQPPASNGVPRSSAAVSATGLQCCRRRPAAHRSAVSSRSRGLPNTRDKLRGARSSTLALGTSEIMATSPYHAPLRLHPPLVSFIALFDGAAV